MSGLLLRIRLAVVLSLILLGFTPATDAGPFRNFFRKVRYAFAHPEQARAPQRTGRHRADARPKYVTTSSIQSKTPVSSPPNQVNTRAASAIGAHRAVKADLPYAAPVPGKKGFVTSPFAPDSGYVDVREFPPGTQVKDPYTGKIFLTP